MNYIHAVIWGFCGLIMNYTIYPEGSSAINTLIYVAVFCVIGYFIPGKFAPIKKSALRTTITYFITYAITYPLDLNVTLSFIIGMFIYSILFVLENLLGIKTEPADDIEQYIYNLQHSLFTKPLYIIFSIISYTFFVPPLFSLITDEAPKKNTFILIVIISIIISSILHVLFYLKNKHSVNKNTTIHMIN